MTSGPRAVLTFNLTAVGAALLLLCQPAAAQTDAPPADKNLERAQKAADAVFHWIKLNGDKGANRQAPAPAPAPPAPAPVARKPAAPAPVAAAPKPAPSAAPAAAPAVAAAPPPVIAVAAPEPEPERPVLLAAAEPTPAPATPMAAAARAVEPPPPPAEEAEVPLKLLSRVNPGIPRQMQQTSFRDGYARVKFTVAPNGTVSKAETIAASHSRLGTSAVDAVKQWRFAPIPTAREVAIEFAFNNVDD